MIDFKPRPSYLKHQTRTSQTRTSRKRWENIKAIMALVFFIASMLLVEYIDKL